MESTWDSGALAGLLWDFGEDWARGAGAGQSI